MRWFKRGFNVRLTHKTDLKPNFLKLVKPIRKKSTASKPRYLPNFEMKQEQSFGEDKITLKNLISECHEGNVDKVRAILQQQPELVNQNHYGTPLGKAAFMGHLEVVRMLVEDFGADVNLPGGFEKEPPLHQACCFARLNVAAYLISRGANVTARSGHFELPTPLRSALLMLSNDNTPDRLALFRLLVSKGALLGENLNEPIFGKSIKQYICDSLKNESFSPILSALGLNVEEGVEALCQAFTNSVNISDPRSSALAEAFANLSFNSQETARTAPGF